VLVAQVVYQTQAQVARGGIQYLAPLPQMAVEAAAVIQAPAAMAALVVEERLAIFLAGHP
jgi:hypothetical protein